MEAFRKYTNVESSSSEGQALLATHFIVQSAPDNGHNIQKPTAGPQILVNDLLQLASVFYNKDMAEKAERPQRNTQGT